ncbi:MAG TPA: hypothetical protein VMV74_10190 [Bacteroidales bacterium]|nr:hypothetical protein [Bacteroidales bacterium]
MAFFEIRTSTVVSVIIIIAGLLVGGLFLLFGVANLIYPDVPDDYLTRNTIVCLGVCAVGLIPLLVAIATFRGIIHKNKIARGDH